MYYEECVIDGVLHGHGTPKEPWIEVLPAELTFRLQSEKARADAAEVALRKERERLDYIERTFSGMTNRERYLPVQMIWGKACNGRTLREACDKYMAREGKQDAP